MKNELNTVLEIKECLKSRIFTKQGKGSYLFEDDTYAILPGNISLFIPRKDILWANIKPTHKYSISRYGLDFIFRTYKSELCAGENNFVIKVSESEDENYAVAFYSVNGKTECLELLSQ